jgi:glycosyltransferase involved in cell wall biosynthesis
MDGFTTNQVASVSVVIPCYKCVHTIRRAIESIAEQTALPKEVILVEDCSNDGTLEYLEHVRNSHPPGWIKILPLMINRGPAYARNAGWEIASQPYVAFLDADDAWHHQKVQIQYEWMRNNREAVLVGHASTQVRHAETNLALTKGVPAKRVSRLQLLLSNRFSVRTVMFRRELPIGFDPSKRYMEDHWWLLQIAFSNLNIYKIELPLAYTFKADYGEGGLSENLWEMEKAELDNYRRLQESGMIVWPGALFFTMYSLMKYFRRVVTLAAKKQFLRI